MSRLTLWVLATVTGLVALLAYHTSTAGPLDAATSSALASGFAKPSASATPTPSTYAGERVAVRGGTIQVRVRLVGSRITAVDVPLRPGRTRHARAVSRRAVPVLVKETLAAQGAQIRAVRGAAATSAGFVKSLRSALTKAHG